MSNITLSAGIRQNLLSLQNTSAELTTTQEHLATGKKVNTAFDNPTSYFTSQSLTNRANDLSALLDPDRPGPADARRGQNGLTGLTSLLEQALSTAQQAQQTTPTAPAATTGSVALTSRECRWQPVINVGSSSYTVSITASERCPRSKAQINAYSGLGSSGAVTASDDGSGHLLDRQHQHHRVHRRGEFAILRARRHHQRHGQQRRRAGSGHPHHAAG